MAITKRFIVKKDELSEAITYIEYEKINGYDVKPKKNVNIESMINVEKMVIINPSLIEKLVEKKCKRTLDKILKITADIYNDEDGDTGGSLNFILGEIAKFKSLIEHKYKEYMKVKEYKILLKKLEIVENEIKLRRAVLNFNKPQKKVMEVTEKKKGKGR